MNKKKKRRRGADSAPAPLLVIDEDVVVDNSNRSSGKKWTVEEIIHWRNAVRAFQEEDTRKKQKKEMRPTNVTDDLDSDVEMQEALHILNETAYLSDFADDDVPESPKEPSQIHCVYSTEKDPLAPTSEDELFKQEGEESLKAEKDPLAPTSEDELIKQEGEESLKAEKDPLALKCEEDEVVKQEVATSSEEIGNLCVGQQYPLGGDGVNEIESHSSEATRTADVLNDSSSYNDFTFEHLLAATSSAHDADFSTVTAVSDISATLSAASCPNSPVTSDLSPVVGMSETISAAKAATDLSLKSVSCVDVITIDEDDDSDDVVILESRSARDAFSVTSTTEKQLEKSSAFAQTSVNDVHHRAVVQLSGLQAIHCAWCGLECQDGPEAHFTAMKQCKEKSVLMKKWVKQATVCTVCFEPLLGLKNHHNHYAARAQCRNHWLQIIQKLWDTEHRKRQTLNNNMRGSACSSSTATNTSPVSIAVSAPDPAITSSSVSPVPSRIGVPLLASCIIAPANDASSSTTNTAAIAVTAEKTSSDKISPGLESYPCLRCRIMFKDPKPRARHFVYSPACLEVHVFFSPWAVPCGGCGRLFNNNDSFLRHLKARLPCRRRHRKPHSPATCPTCKQQFGSFVEFSVHVKWSVCAVSYPCLNCKEVFPNVRARSQHLVSNSLCRIKHVFEPCPGYKCSTCKRSFVHEMFFNRHTCSGVNLTNMPEPEEQNQPYISTSTVATIMNIVAGLALGITTNTPTANTTTTPSSVIVVDATMLPSSSIYYMPFGTTRDSAVSNMHSTSATRSSMSYAATSCRRLRRLAPSPSRVDNADSTWSINSDNRSVTISETISEDTPSPSVVDAAIAALSVVNVSDTFGPRYVPSYQVYHCVLCHDQFAERQEFLEHLKSVLPCRVAFLIRNQLKQLCLCCNSTFRGHCWRRAHLRHYRSHQCAHQKYCESKVRNVLQPGQGVLYCEDCCSAFLSPGEYHCFTCLAAFSSMDTLRQHWGVSPVCQRFLKVVSDDLVQLDSEQNLRGEQASSRNEEVTVQHNAKTPQLYAKASQLSAKTPQLNAEVPHQNSEIRLLNSEASSCAASQDVKKFSCPTCKMAFDQRPALHTHWEQNQTCRRALKRMQSATSKLLN